MNYSISLLKTKIGHLFLHAIVKKNNINSINFFKKNSFVKKFNAPKNIFNKQKYDKKVFFFFKKF